MSDKIQPSAEAIAKFEEGIRQKYRSQFTPINNAKPTPKLNTIESNNEREPQQFKPATSINITHKDKVSAPNIGLPEGSKVRGPSKASLQKAEKADAERRLAKIEQKQKEDELVRELSPDKLLNKLMAAERCIKTLQKKVAKLEEDTNA